MAARSKAPVIPKQIVVELSDELELAIDITAFSSAYYSASFAAIAREAIKDHIERTLDREPDRKAAFLQIRAALTKKPIEPLRVLDRVPRSEQSS